MVVMPFEASSRALRHTYGADDLAFKVFELKAAVL